MCKCKNVQIKCRKTAGKFRDRAISKSKCGSADEMRRKLAKEHREQEKTERGGGIGRGERERERAEQCKRAKGMEPPQSGRHSS